ncbi:isoprenylcysteine alpha-carbonyl methylesterase ICME isoform X3 [Momordica charantia]|uniref:protein-S-isoprenylcysteine alpha-carbonyl methylesterase n=1 Tax=Momordica charantia TaxID=3673 RepID=A0A6J1CQ25_MOMCH|nr:isoprenylcysteine alpha-carbonyl methylesterase ICME isoform X3 [Momordica charantia]
MAAPADRLPPVSTFPGPGICFDVDPVETQPLLSRMLNYPLGIIHHPLRRRLGAAKPQLPRRQQSFSQECCHAAKETVLLTRLSFTLLRSLGVGYRWVVRLTALAIYAILLMPGFLQVMYDYYYSSQVRRDIIYGDQPRNSLDLYLPRNTDKKRPVVIFVSGGAWIIGNKAWGALLGLQLAERDIIVASIDYRNFPQATISDMVKDVSKGVSFVCNNIADYGGDPNRIFLMGQSAGAHISVCALLEQAIKEAGKGDSVDWSVCQIKSYFGLSGGYNLLKLIDHFDGRGLYRSLFLSIMEDASESFAETLGKAGAQADLFLYEGKTHTDLFLQDPFRGGNYELFDDIVAILHACDEEALAKDSMAPPKPRLVPEILIRLARMVSPF